MQGNELKQYEGERKRVSEQEEEEKPLKAFSTAAESFETPVIVISSRSAKRCTAR